MNVDTGEIKPLEEFEKMYKGITTKVSPLPTTLHVPEHLVNCPNSKKAQSVMGDWGINKRQRYAHLVKDDRVPTYIAFYLVEYNNGEKI